MMRVVTHSTLKFPPHTCEQESEVRREKMESSERGPDVVRRFCAVSERAWISGQNLARDNVLGSVHNLLTTSGPPSLDSVH